MRWVHFPHPLLLQKIFTSRHHHFRCQRHLKTCTKLLLFQIPSPGHLKNILRKVGSNTLTLLLERWGLDTLKQYWKGGVLIPWNCIGKARFGYLETILERRGLDTLKQYWKGRVWIPWNYIGKARFGYLETILERWGLDTLKQYWKGRVWIPPELEDNLNSRLSFGLAAPTVCLSESIACLPEAMIKLQACDLHFLLCVCVLRMILFLLHVSHAYFACDLSLFQVAASCPYTMVSPNHKTTKDTF